MLQCSANQKQRPFSREEPQRGTSEQLIIQWKGTLWWWKHAHFFKSKSKGITCMFHSHLVCELDLDMLSDPQTFVFTLILIYIVTGLQFIRWRSWTDFVSQTTDGCLVFHFKIKFCDVRLAALIALDLLKLAGNILYLLLFEGATCSIGTQGLK